MLLPWPAHRVLQPNRSSLAHTTNATQKAASWWRYNSVLLLLLLLLLISPAGCAALPQPGYVVPHGACLALDAWSYSWSYSFAGWCLCAAAAGQGTTQQELHIITHGQQQPGGRM
jgi:hypothetical protein